MNFYINLGAKLRALREGVKLSQERMGDVLGVSFQMVQKYEKGVCRIPVHRLIQWLNICKADRNQFMEAL